MNGRDFSGKQVGRYLLSSLLGTGAAGTVYRAVDITLADSPTFAIKCIPESPIYKRRRQQRAEVDNHGVVVGSPHVMMLCDVFERNGYFFLVLPLCEMDMFRAIFREKLYWRNDELIKKMFLQVLDGVFACHKRGVFHRDLKPENIMCDENGIKAQIGDFGLSTNRRLCRDGSCGTVSYMSPECLDETMIFYYADPVDIWSLGVILFNMVTCRYPWEEARTTDEDYNAFLTKKDHLLHTSPISKSLSDLLFKIWHPTPMRRLPVQAIRQAIVEMDTFYKPHHGRSSHAPSPLSKAVDLVDSEQTFVAPVEDEKNKGPTDKCDLVDGTLVEIPLCCD